MVGVTLASPTHASRSEVERCIRTVAKNYGMSELPLQIIYRMEGGTVGEISRPNSNGSHDIGPMQINSWWLPKLAEAGISYEDLRDDACINVLVAAWIYTQEFRRTKDVAKAIAAYHSRTPVHQARYLAKVSEHLDRMIAEAERSGRAAVGVGGSR